MLLEIIQTSNFTDEETDVEKRHEKNGSSVLLLLSLIFLVELGLLNMGS